MSHRGSSPGRPGNQRPPRPAALAAAETGAERWHAAVVAQQQAEADHAGFYALAVELVHTLRALEGLARVLAGQVGDSGCGRRLYDDSRRVDPAERLAAAAAALGHLGHLLGQAERTANTFWSEIGHIGEEADPC